METRNGYNFAANKIHSFLGKTMSDNAQQIDCSACNIDQELKLLYEVKSAVFSEEYDLLDPGKEISDIHAELTACNLPKFFEPIMRYLHKMDAATVVVPNFWMTDGTQYTADKDIIFCTENYDKQKNLIANAVEVIHTRTTSHSQDKCAFLSEYVCKAPLMVCKREDHCIGDGNLSRDLARFNDINYPYGFLGLNFDKLRKEKDKDKAITKLNQGLVGLYGKSIPDDNILPALNTLIQFNSIAEGWKELWYVPLYRPGGKPLAVCLTFVYKPEKFKQALLAYETALHIGFAAAAMRFGHISGEAKVRKLRVFICYKREQSEQMNGIKNQVIIQCEGLIEEAWNDGDLMAGDPWEKEILNHLNNANLILILVSEDFLLKSEWCKKEKSIAMRRKEQGDCIVIPIIVDPTGLPQGLAGLQAVGDKDNPVNNPDSYINAGKKVKEKINKYLKIPP
ncbi:MAG: toll/interleukin-1 receptor domain-containing protein [Candidatus Methylumidiphilus sp.]